MKMLPQLKPAAEIGHARARAEPAATSGSATVGRRRRHEHLHLLDAEGGGLAVRFLAHAR